MAACPGAFPAAKTPPAALPTAPRCRSPSTARRPSPHTAPSTAGRPETALGYSEFKGGRRSRPHPMVSPGAAWSRACLRPAVPSQAPQPPRPRLTPGASARRGSASPASISYSTTCMDAAVTQAQGCAFPIPLPDSLRREIYKVLQTVFLTALLSTCFL